jgi:thymidylate synthase
MGLVRDEGVEEDSRNGALMVLPGPLLTHYTNPERRVLFDVARDANPFFHLYESMWMLTGWDNIQVLKNFNSNIATFSDDGETLNGAYGDRWRVHFGYDQIPVVIALLDKDPTTRRAVLGMWDTREDLVDQHSKDLPCNTHIYFRRRDRYLDMTSCCRSNDLVWGCYGANVVHMSVLHEYIASKLQLRPGSYYQFSNNAHVYKRHYHLLKQPEASRGYKYKTLTMDCWLIGWDDDCRKFVADPYQLPNNYTTPWFEEVMAPLGLAHQAYKKGLIDSAVDFARQIEADDWKIACINWLERRRK